MVREARLGLLLASRATTLAVWIFHTAHFGTTDANMARLTALAKKTNGLRDTWKNLEE
jgi:hypothetical protein